MIRKKNKEIGTESSAIVGGGSSRRFLPNVPRVHLNKQLSRTLLILLCGVVVGGILLYGYRKSPANISCTNDTKLIDEYNNTMKQQGVTKLQTIQKKVTEKRNYANDATCMYMMMVAQYGNADTKGEIDSLDRLKKLESSGKTVSKKVDTSKVNRGVLEKFIQRLKDEQGKTFNGVG